MCEPLLMCRRVYIHTAPVGARSYLPVTLVPPCMHQQQNHPNTTLNNQRIMQKLAKIPHALAKIIRQLYLHLLIPALRICICQLASKNVNSHFCCCYVALSRNKERYNSCAPAKPNCTSMTSKQLPSLHERPRKRRRMLAALFRKCPFTHAE
jgi:hypothetical protein